MRKWVYLGWLCVISVFIFSFVAVAGEPLVTKTKEGKFVPAVAQEWVKAGEDSFGFVLKTGKKAGDVAIELKDKVAPIEVLATDDFTLVFKSKGLTEQTLLEKLAAIPLEQEKSAGDALAALTGTGDEGGPALSDLSGSGSIRASKKIELTGQQSTENLTELVVGKVVRMQYCEPMPTVTIQVITPPNSGEFKNMFKKGRWYKVRGYFKIAEDTGLLDSADERTNQNIESKKFKWGHKVAGKPLTQDGDIWIFDTLQKQ